MVAFAYSAGDAVTAVDSGKRALEILGSVRVVLSAFVHSAIDKTKWPQSWFLSLNINIGLLFSWGS